MIRSSLRRSGFLLLSAELGACAQAALPAASFTAGDKAAIDSVGAEVMAISNGSQNYDAMAETGYAPDAIELPPNQPAVQGRAAIAEFLGSFSKVTSFGAQTLDLTGAGDLAYQYGTYHMVMEGPNGPMTDDGKFIEVWKRQTDGSWKVPYDMLNSDVPATR
jgi:ketosteroid isomerase-like protein